MAGDRPTFNESWYRVSSLKPQLLGALKVHRQHYRGLRWYVLQDPAGDRYFRLNAAAYAFVAMLDGRRTVAQVWQTCLERYGDAAPTQGEALDLLGRLHAANLLQTNLAPDAELLFRRYRKRKWREVRGVLSQLFFIRIPLWDPNRFLDRWAGVFGRLFTGWGALAWLAAISAGLGSIGGHTAELARQTGGVLNPANLPLLYTALVIVKIMHELGHAFACKHFGRRAGTGGEVHRLGVTFLVFTPLPFVDASSAWTLRSKWHRIVIGASGVLVELAVASVAAVIWVHTAEGTSLHAIAYNMIFIAGVSALMFNANPLLRYDAYYILADLLEIPNLDSRSKMYVAYLIKRYLWGIRGVRDPSHTRTERGWLVFYAVASTICRMLVFAAIIVFLGNKVFLIGVLFALITFFGWILLPLGRLMRYLATDSELERNRGRAVSSVAATCLAVSIVLGVIQFPDRCRVEGVVEPAAYAVIHMQTAGFVNGFLASGSRTGPGGPPLVSAASPELNARYAQLLAESRQMQVRRQSAQTRETVKVQIMQEKMAALKEQIQRTERDMDALVIPAPITGIWVAPDIERIPGKYLPRGQRIGVVAGLDTLRIRAVAGQTVAARLIRESEPRVAVRVKGRPDIELAGRVENIIPAGQQRLPTAALGYTAGGATRIDAADPSGRQATEPFFEIVVRPAPDGAGRLLPGQTVVLRFETLPKPLWVQALRSMQQVFQKRFEV